MHAGLQKDMLAHVNEDDLWDESTSHVEAQELCEQHFFLHHSVPAHKTALQLHVAHGVSLDHMQVRFKILPTYRP